MAESLTAEQLEERRTNLRAFRKLLEMDDDSELTTTLLMQEEWLATVDALQTYVGDLVQDAYTLRGLRTRKCFGPTGGLALECSDCYDDIKEYCALCYLRAIHKPEGETPLPATSIKVDPDAFAPLPLHGVSIDEPRSRFRPDERVKGYSMQYRVAGEAYRPVGVNNCPTCGAGDETFVDGDCPTCNPLVKDKETSRISLENVQKERPDTCSIAGQGHVWVKMGKVGLNDHGLSGMEWGETKCLRCNMPKLDFDETD